MRIRSQLIASLSFATVVCSGALFGLVTYLHTEDGLRQAQERAQTAAHAAADLLMLTEEFVFTGRPRVASRWHARAAAIDAAIRPEAKDPPERARSLQTLRIDLTDIGGLFAELERSPSQVASARVDGRSQALADRLLARTQALSGNTYVWAAELATERQRVSQRRLWIFTGISLAFTLVIAQLAYVVLRRVLQPLARLQQAAAAIRDGDATVPIDTEPANELGDLARQLAGMTAALTERNDRLACTAAELAAEAALRSETEKRIRLVTDNLPVLVAYVDTDGRYRFVNRQYEFMLGLDHVNMVGRRVRDVLGEANFERVKTMTDEALSGKTAVFEVRMETEYSARDLWASYVPDFDAHGAVQGFFVMHEDITVQKQSAADLRALNDRYALATRSGGVGVWDWNVASRELTCDLQMHALYQMPSETGRPATFRQWTTRIHPDDAARAEQEFRDALRGTHLYDTEFRLLLPDGSQRVVKASGTVKRDASGQPISMVGLNWDISALRNAQSEQRKIEERFRLLADNVADYAIIMLDADGHIETWNGAAKQMKGYAADEILGRHFSTFYTASDVLRKHPAALLDNAVIHGRSHELGWRVKKDGTLFWADVTITALRDASGSLRGFGKVIRDLTAQKQKEETIARALQEKEVLVTALSGQVSATLQAVTNLLQQQVRTLGPGPAFNALQESIARIAAMETADADQA